MGKSFGALPAPIAHPCGRAAKALDDTGQRYERKEVKGGSLKLWTLPNRARDRAKIEQLTGQRAVPILVLDDGSTVVGSGAIVRWAREHAAEASTAGRRRGGPPWCLPDPDRRRARPGQALQTALARHHSRLGRPVPRAGDGIEVCRPAPERSGEDADAQHAGLRRQVGHRDRVGRDGHRNVVEHGAPAEQVEAGARVSGRPQGDRAEAPARRGGEPQPGREGEGHRARAVARGGGQRRRLTGAAAQAQRQVARCQLQLGLAGPAGTAQEQRVDAVGETGEPAGTDDHRPAAAHEPAVDVRVHRDRGAERQGRPRGRGAAEARERPVAAQAHRVREPDAAAHRLVGERAGVTGE
ncbi:MAG: glutathione S-transferase N-terminal domain-containing protein [Solirubrobacteraceae bacterium]